MHVTTLWILIILSKMLGQDSLHEGSSCEMVTLVDLVVGDAGWPSGAWMEGLK